MIEITKIKKTQRVFFENDGKWILWLYCYEAEKKCFITSCKEYVSVFLCAGFILFFSPQKLMFVVYWLQLCFFRIFRIFLFLLYRILLLRVFFLRYTLVCMLFFYIVNCYILIFFCFGDFVFWFFFEWIDHEYTWMIKRMFSLITIKGK